MAVKSKAQRRKFAQLLVEGKIKPDVYERWNREAGKKNLAERVRRKNRKPKSSVSPSTSRPLISSADSPAPCQQLSRHPTSGSEIARVESKMIFDERGDEEVAVVVARLQAKLQGHARLPTG